MTQTKNTSANHAQVHYGVVFINHGGHVHVKDLETHALCVCPFQKSNTDIVCGDVVVYQPLQNDQGKILEIHPRNNEIFRLKNRKKKIIASNIDYLWVVLAPAPKPDWLLLDQYLLFAKHHKINAHILMNKCVQTNPKSNVFQQMLCYEAIGYCVFYLSALEEPEKTHTLFKNKEYQGKRHIFCGQSGVGKSTIIGSLLKNTQIQTQTLSNNQGTHCTSATSLYCYENDVQIIDSPGIRQLHLPKLTASAIQRGFVEIERIKHQCYFSNCQHTTEKECAVKLALQSKEIAKTRYENYQYLLSLDKL